MDFEERVQKVIADGLAHIEEEQRLDAEFKREWEEVRQTVWSVLGQAVRASRNTAFGPLKADRTEQGCTVLKLLGGSSSGATASETLLFCPDEMTRTIVCSVQPAKLAAAGEGFPESFELNALTEAVIEAKVEAFLAAVLKRRAEKRPPGRYARLL